MTAIRSHFAPDNIEGVQQGDTVLFHVTNLEQDWDVPHGFAAMGSTNDAELLVMPGQTRTLTWVASTPASIRSTAPTSAARCTRRRATSRGPSGAAVALSATTSKKSRPPSLPRRRWQEATFQGAGAAPRFLSLLEA